VPALGSSSVRDLFNVGVHAEGPVGLGEGDAGIAIWRPDSTNDPPLPANGEYILVQSSHLAKNVLAVVYGNQTGTPDPINVKIQVSHNLDGRVVGIPNDDLEVDNIYNWERVDDGWIIRIEWNPHTLTWQALQMEFTC
jgi:hypothetical protein